MAYMNIWDRKKQDFSLMYLVVDTGASVTTLSKDLLQLAGHMMPNSNKKKITTASGVEFVDEIILDKIKLGGLEMSNIPVYAHTFPEESFSSGVIGMNILSCFNLEFLFDSNELILSYENDAA
ncbi:MAG: retroviral-like aspartic protease family protein [Clostridiales Family XIII bacterium]|nr:retroviral-like aspartic protease family protein [Clostridiales Family XIII bacterium]